MSWRLRSAGMLVPWVGWAGDLSVLQQLEQEAPIKPFTGRLGGLVREQNLEEPWFTESQALASRNCEIHGVAKSRTRLSDWTELNCVCGLPRCLSGKEPACQCGRCEFNLWIGKIPLEKEMATHSSILSCLGNSMDRGTWQAIVHGVAKELGMT